MKTPKTKNSRNEQRMKFENIIFYTKYCHIIFYTKYCQIYEKQRKTMVFDQFGVFLRIHSIPGILSGRTHHVGTLAQDPRPGPTMLGPIRDRWEPVGKD